jgi:hypothetical protein
VSYFAQVRFNEPDEVTYVVQLKRFLLVRPVRAEQAPLRLAVAHVYTSLAPEGSMLRADPSRVWSDSSRGLDGEDYLIDVHSIDCKLACAFPQGHAAAACDMFFMRYSNLSHRK